VEVQHKERGSPLTVGSPIKFSISPRRSLVRSPLLGEHTDDVPTELGYDVESIAAMHAAGVV
jgi:formyl-CoA transferase